MMICTAVIIHERIEYKCPTTYKSEFHYSCNTLLYYKYMGTHILTRVSPSLSLSLSHTYTHTQIHKWSRSWSSIYTHARTNDRCHFTIDNTQLASTHDASPMHVFYYFIHVDDARVGQGRVTSPSKHKLYRRFRVDIKKHTCMHSRIGISTHMHAWPWYFNQQKKIMQWQT